MNEIELYSPLEEWINRNICLPSFIELNLNNLNFEFGGFLILNNIALLHETVNLKPESLDISWKKTNEYLEKAFNIINESIFDKILLDREESEMIIDKLGNPPNISHPIYIMTISNSEKEEIVYIGQTSSSKNRFQSGHTAITKLHAPEFNGYEKKIYQCGVLFLNNDKELVPLEWIKPLPEAKRLLDSIEAQLIYYFKPQLNTQLKKKNNTTQYIQLHLQNRNNCFMHDIFV